MRRPRRNHSPTFQGQGGPAPSGDVAQDEPDQLGRHVITGEVAAGFDDLAQPHMHALDGIDGVDDATDFRRDGEERDDLGPGPAPRGHHRRELGTPGTVANSFSAATSALGAV